MKKEYIINYKPENCPRCKAEFVCKPKNISECDCMKIRTSPEELNFIASKFSSCVCNSCLKELKHEYLLNYEKNNGIKFNV
jgi:hypothetical protein